MANKNNKQAMKGSDQAQVDQNLNVRVGSINIEYRKEYIEFFLAFFRSNQEMDDEVTL